MDRMKRIGAGVLGCALGALVVALLWRSLTGPRVVNMLPPDSSSPATTVSIILEFSEAMDHRSVEGHLSITPPVAGHTLWQGNSLMFTTDRPLAASQKYQVSLASGSRSLSGKSIDGTVTWSFTPHLSSVLYLAPANSDTRSLWRVTVGDASAKVFAPPRGVDSFVADPTGAQVAVTVPEEGEAADLWLVDSTGAHRDQITHCAPDYCGQATWSPDGRRLAYERRKPESDGDGAAGRIWIYDVHDRASTSLFADTGVVGYNPVWSPDGNRIALFDPQAQGIRVVEISTGKSLFLPSQTGEVGTFAPDGNAMAYSDIRPVGGQFFSEIWLADFRPTVKIDPLDDQAEEDQSPAWSPGGQYIAFARRRIDRKEGFGSQLFLYEVETRTLRKITDDLDYNNTAFHWSRGGNELLIQRHRLSGTASISEVWLYDMIKQSLTQIVSDGYGAQWLP